MNDADDIGFTFDPLPFLNGLKAVSSGIERLGDRTVSATKGMGKAFQGALLKVEAIKVALKAGIATIKQYMPEIGKTLEIAKDIFFKNFLWPLRKAIAPFLQYLLTWVRDNRASFVKWGQVLANAFRVVVTIAKALWTVLKSVWEAMKPIFGKSLSDAVNVILTKIAVMASFIGVALEGIIKWVAEIAPALAPVAEAFGLIVKAVADFAGGAIVGFLETMKTGKFHEAVSNLAISFKKLIAAIFGENGEYDWTKFGENFGAKFADALEGLVNLLALTFDGITVVVDAIKSLFNVLGAGEVGKKWKAAKESGAITPAQYKDYQKWQLWHKDNGELINDWGVGTGHMDQAWTPGIKWDKEGTAHPMPVGQMDPLNPARKPDMQGSWFEGQTDVFDNPIPPPWQKGTIPAINMTGSLNTNPVIAPKATTPPLLTPSPAKPTVPGFTAWGAPATHESPAIQAAPKIIIVPITTPLITPKPSVAPGTLVSPVKPKVSAPIVPSVTPTVPKPVPVITPKGASPAQPQSALPVTPLKQGVSRESLLQEGKESKPIPPANVSVSVAINMPINSTAKQTAQATYDAVINQMVAEGVR